MHYPMPFLLSALAFLLLLSVLILIHECGHFFAARAAGVKVEEFGFGLPPRAKTLFKKGGTIFSLNWVPFGGFVRLKGENAFTQKERRAKGSFASAPLHSRIIILVAGVFMNFVLALILLTIGFSVGRWVPTYMSFPEMEAAADKGVIEMQLGVFIEDVVSGGSAAQIGVPKKSRLLAVDGVSVERKTDVDPLQRGKQMVEYTVLTGDNLDEKLIFDVPLRDSMAGVSLLTYPFHLSAPKRDVGKAFVLALRESYVMTTQTIIGIGHLFSSLARSGTVPEGIAGIVGIAQLTHDSVQAGLMNYLRLVALLSLSLAVLNILPFPALDGGRLMFVLVEVISRRPINYRFEVATNAIGFVFLLFLILLITVYDIIRLF
jgi:regulator of sigma E protease